MPSLRVAPENKDTVPKRKKLVRRRSTKRWWLTDEAKQEMKNEFDSLVQLTERSAEGLSSATDIPLGHAIDIIRSLKA